MPIARLTGRTYQDWLVRTPVRHGGLEMRSMADVSLLAFMSGLEQAVPRFVGDEGVMDRWDPHWAG